MYCTVQYMFHNNAPGGPGTGSLNYSTSDSTMLQVELVQVLYSTVPGTVLRYSTVLQVGLDQVLYRTVPGTVKCSRHYLVKYSDLGWSGPGTVQYRTPGQQSPGTIHYTQHSAVLPAKPGPQAGNEEQNQ